MKKLTIFVLTIILIHSNTLSGNRTIEVKKGESLQTAIDIAVDGDTILIYEGEFKALPRSYIEEECGNCSNQNTIVTASAGFVVQGKAVVIKGAGQFKTKLITNAGYGFLFQNSSGSSISNLTISGGTRDRDVNATNGGIVTKNSIVHIKNIHIKDNEEYSDDTVVGISGIVGRENSELVIEKCSIRNNSWDGIVLYRGAVAVIKENTIEQGRGVGIGITWDAKATVIKNSVSYYWKGIGTFGNSNAIVKNNLVFENMGWGIVITGSSNMEVANNVVDKNGNCGIAVWESTAVGKIYNNIITNNGWRDEWVCPQVGYWMNGDSVNVDFSYNNLWNNIMGNYRLTKDLTGINGNLSVDPFFIPEKNYKLDPASPMKNAGSFHSNGKGKRFPIGKLD